MFGRTLTGADNQGAISLTKDASYHTHSKHIDVAHHFVCERSCFHLPTFAQDVCRYTYKVTGWTETSTISWGNGYIMKNRTIS